jgi:hypothetical protein
MKKKIFKIIGACLIASMCLIGCGNKKQEKKTSTTSSAATEEREIKKDDQTLVSELGQSLKTDIKNFSISSTKLFGYNGNVRAIKYKNNNNIETIKWSIPYSEENFDDLYDKMISYYNNGSEDIPDKYDVYTYYPEDDNIKEITFSHNYETINVTFSATEDKISSQKPKRSAYEAYNKVINTYLDSTDADEDSDDDNYDVGVTPSQTSLGVDENGDPAYEDTITLTQISQKDVELDMYDGMMPPDAVYVKLLYYIEGSYILQNGWKNYSPYIFDPVPKNYKQFKQKREKIKSLFKTSKPTPNLYRHLKRLHSVKGTLDINNGLAAGCDFKITNLKKCAKELHVSQECVGYILAYLSAHNCEVTFSNNHKSCTVVDSNTYDE